MNGVKKTMEGDASKIIRNIVNTFFYIGRTRGGRKSSVNKIDHIRIFNYLLSVSYYPLIISFKLPWMIIVRTIYR